MIDSHQAMKIPNNSRINNKFTKNGHENTSLDFTSIVPAKDSGYTDSSNCKRDKLHFKSKKQFNSTFIRSKNSSENSSTIRTHKEVRVKSK